MNDPLYRSLRMLRQDAIERGLQEVAIVYGWSLLRLGEEILIEKYAALRRPIA